MDQRAAARVRVGDRLRLPFYAKTITVADVIKASDDPRDAVPLFRAAEDQALYSQRLCRPVRIEEEVS